MSQRRNVEMHKSRQNCDNLYPLYFTKLQCQYYLCSRVLNFAFLFFANFFQSWKLVRIRYFIIRHFDRVFFFASQYLGAFASWTLRNVPAVRPNPSSLHLPSLWSRETLRRSGERFCGWWLAGTIICCRESHHHRAISRKRRRQIKQHNHVRPGALLHVFSRSSWRYLHTSTP